MKNTVELGSLQVDLRNEEIACDLASAKSLISELEIQLDQNLTEHQEGAREELELEMDKLQLAHVQEAAEAEYRIAALEHELVEGREAKEHAEEQHAAAVKALFAERQALQASKAREGELCQELQVLQKQVQSQQDALQPETAPRGSATRIDVEIQNAAEKAKRLKSQITEKQAAKAQQAELFRLRAQVSAYLNKCGAEVYVSDTVVLQLAAQRTKLVEAEAVVAKLRPVRIEMLTGMLRKVVRARIMRQRLRQLVSDASR